MADSVKIEELIQIELTRITKIECSNAIRSMLIEPRCELRDWDYSIEATAYPCWIILDHQQSNTCIAYCEQGFGPACPWGLMCISGPWLSMGPDYQWYSRLEDAFRQSQAWEGTNPDEYEIQ